MHPKFINWINKLLEFKKYLLLVCDIFHKFAALIYYNDNNNCIIIIIIN